MGNKTILLVEDNPNDQELTLWALRKNNIGNHVAIANDGVDALDYLFSTGMHAGRDPVLDPTLILLDLNLPRLGGLDVLKAIRKDARTQLIPVVVLTSSQEDQDVISSYRFGANGYVCKPVDLNKFTEMVAQLGVFWLTINVQPPFGGLSSPPAS